MAGSVKEACETLAFIGVPDRDVAMYSTLSVKTPHENMTFRKLCLDLGYESQENARELWMLCARDPLFFFNTFAWLLEARTKQDWDTSSRYGTSNVIPFITRGYQDSLILKCVENLGRQDIVVPKSRETGISWIMCALAAWDWIFHDQTHIGFVSKDLLSANNPDDPDALFSKFEFLIKRLPFWMMSPSDYERNITKNTFKNVKNNSSLTAYAAKADIGRGGRKAWMLMDEFHFFDQGDDYAALDSTVHVTPCRVFVSTANRDRGMAGAFYDTMSDETRNGVRVIVDWKDDPDKRRGLYHGELIPGTDTYRLIIDDMDFWSHHSNFDGKTYRHPTKPGENYPFIVDERTRSLYYDHVWMRPGSTPQSVSAELDRNFGGATAQIFNPTLLAQVIEAAKPPIMSGDLVRNPEKLDEWIFEKLSAGGMTHFWCNLENGRPPKSDYAIGADVSAGTGGEWSSYSALEVIDKQTGEHVFEWRSNRLDPIQFGELAVWVCKWFWNAYLIPEVNGPLGQLFINKAVRDLKYGNVYHEIKQKVAYRQATERIGYINNDRGISLLKNMESAVRGKRVHLNSILALKECGRYFLKNGKLVHSAAEVTEDGAGMGLAHGDAAIALGCAVYGVDDIPVKAVVEMQAEAPYQSFLWRRQQFEKMQLKSKQKSYWKPE
mgnify:CR=1 FL=1